MSRVIGLQNVHNQSSKEMVMNVAMVVHPIATNLLHQVYEIQK